MLPGHAELFCSAPDRLAGCRQNVLAQDGARMATDMTIWIVIRTPVP